MASTDSTIPDSSTGDSAGAQAGDSFADKVKTAVKGNIPVMSSSPHVDPSQLSALQTAGGGEQNGEKEVKKRMDQGVGTDTGSSKDQNTLL